MIVGIDGNEANQKIRTGSGVYSLELLRQFKKFQISPASISTGRANFKFQIYLKNSPLKDLPSEDSNFEYKIVKPVNFWTQIGLPFQLWKEKITRKAPDIFFSLTHYAPRFCPIPSLITIFDLSFIKFPKMFLKKDLYQLRNWTEYSIRQAKKIITISEFSKNDISNYYKISPDKIVVAYPGYDKNKFNTQIKNQKSKIKSTIQKFKIDREYILYVGTIQPRKNISRLIDAFRLLNNDYPGLQLVICGMIKEGRGGWMNDEIIDKIKKSKFGRKDSIIITGYVIDKDLQYLMAGAKTLVLPSLYEGFGIPVIEAMACGCPVVVSSGISLAEIANGAAILVNPFDVRSIANGLKEACYNNLRRQDLIKKGLIQIERYDWEKSAEIIFSTIQSVKNDRSKRQNG
ncbi:glycosyltransferase family 4 protein [Candidatus Gottesmanbacteria bacterium]|nr:glycosyltransferase family 4 protein [Candidatus Gottesmanbacteria bacterium]